MKQDVGGARRTNSEERADDAGSGHRGFQNVRLEPLIEKIRGAHGHELHEVVFVFSVEILKALAEEGEFFQVARIEGSGIRRNHGENRLYEPAHRDHRLAEFFVGFGVEFGVALEFAARFSVIVLAPEIIAAGHRRDRAVEREDFQAVAREIEIANDFRAKQRDNVREDGKFETGNDFFGNGRAAENIATLENQDFLACLGEIRRIHEAVVAAADYDDVVFLRHEFSR